MLAQLIIQIPTSGKVVPLRRRCGTRSTQDVGEDRSAIEGPHDFRRDRMSVTAISKEFETACDACEVHRGMAMRLFKQYLTVPAGAVEKRRVTLSNSDKFFHDSESKTYSAVAQLLRKRYISGDHISRRNAGVRNLRQGLMTLVELAQALCSTTQICK